MNNWGLTAVGAVVVIIAAGAITAVLCARGRRGPGRVAIALLWGAFGLLGTALLTTTITPGQVWVLPVGITLAGVCVASALVLAVIRHREVIAAQQRDAALGQPPLITAPPVVVVMCASGLVAVVVAGMLIAPWMLAAASAAGLAPAAIVPGLISNIAVAAPIIWVPLAVLARRRTVRVAYEAEVLRRGVELRVADAAAQAAHAECGQARGIRYRTGEE